jgi:hypothetical protein
MSSRNASEDDTVSIGEAAKYVAAAYGVILAVLIVYYLLSARRVSALERDLRVLEDTVQKQEKGNAPGGSA